jgi:negative regulator of flagellin synthesis FlgM
MMGKMNIDKIRSFDPIRNERQTEIKKAVRDTGPPTKTTKGADRDELNLSNRASAFGKLVDQIKELPDVRTDKVESLRDQISSGNYKPSSDKIADAILRDEKV